MADEFALPVDAARPAADVGILRRTLEAEVARLQFMARTAAEQGDWDAVTRLLVFVREISDDNPWMLDIAAYLEDLCQQRDTQWCCSKISESGKS